MRENCSTSEYQVILVIIYDSLNSHLEVIDRKFPEVEASEAPASIPEALEEAMCCMPDCQR